MVNYHYGTKQKVIDLDNFFVKELSIRKRPFPNPEQGQKGSETLRIKPNKIEIKSPTLPSSHGLRHQQKTLARQ
jgi:hypothetical protein